MKLFVTLQWETVSLIGSVPSACICYDTQKKPYHKHDVVIGRIFAFVRVLLMEVIIYVECRCFFFERNLLFSRTEGLSGYDYELKTKNEKYKFSNFFALFSRTEQRFLTKVSM